MSKVRFLHFDDAAEEVAAADGLALWWALEAGLPIQASELPGGGHGQALRPMPATRENTTRAAALAG